MSKLQRIAITAIILLSALCISAGAQAPLSPAQEYDILSIYAPMLEVDHWGAREGIRNLSFIGTWQRRGQSIWKISKQGSKIIMNEDFGQGFRTSEWISIKGNTALIHDITVLKRSTRKPNFKIRGRFLSYWTTESGIGLGLSTTGPNIIVTTNQGGKVFDFTLQIKNGEWVATGSNGKSVAFLTRATSNSKPGAGAWKQLLPKTASGLECLIGLTQTYANDHGGKFQPAQARKLFTSKEVLGSRSDYLFKQIGTNEYYKWNTALDGKKISALKQMDGVLMFYEAKPWPDGSRYIAFTSALDGETSPILVTAAQWAKVAKVNHLK